MAVMMRAARTIFSLQPIELVSWIQAARRRQFNVPGLADVEDIDTVSTGLPQVGYKKLLEFGSGGMR